MAENKCISSALEAKEQIIKTCEFWVKHQKGNDLCLAFSAVEELLEVLKEDERLIKNLTQTVNNFMTKDRSWLNEWQTGSEGSSKEN